MADALIADEQRVVMGPFMVHATAFTDGRILVGIKTSGSGDPIEPDIQVDAQTPDWKAQVKRAWSEKMRRAQLVTKREAEEAYNLDFLREPQS